MVSRPFSDCNVIAALTAGSISLPPVVPPIVSVVPLATPPVVQPVTQVSGPPAPQLVWMSQEDWQTVVTRRRPRQQIVTRKRHGLLLKSRKGVRGPVPSSSSEACRGQHQYQNCGQDGRAERTCAISRKDLLGWISHYFHSCEKHMPKQRRQNQSRNLH